ncbi:hypothetical protein MA16_Dca026111 [Dendrobium catenatum]|uniref:Uncharacterized protein n=1 Tax=Dendrobium catenatum TaxID=906689 RepID=A0A2I0W4C9_9ASPA|nr:hypothetical protein MA16_Dca026111 [Dendrobium catenatum]
MDAVPVRVDPLQWCQLVNKWSQPQDKLHAYEMLAEEGLTPEDGNFEANEKIFKTIMGPEHPGRVNGFCFIWRGVYRCWCFRLAQLVSGCVGPSSDERNLHFKPSSKIEQNSGFSCNPPYMFFHSQHQQSKVDGINLIQQSSAPCFFSNLNVDNDNIYFIQPLLKDIPNPTATIEV